MDCEKRRLEHEQEVLKNPNNVSESVIALYSFSMSNEKMDQVIWKVLSKVTKKDIERFWLAGIKAKLMPEAIFSQNDKVKNLQHCLWSITRLLLVFCWFALEMRDYDTMCLNWILKIQVLQKISINYRSIFIMFNHLFACLKTKFGPVDLHGASFAYLMLITVLYLIWWKGHWESYNEVRSQSQKRAYY